MTDTDPLFQIASKPRTDSPLATAFLSSPNHDPRAEGARVECLILHYTGMESGAAALARLRDPQSRVASHYVVEEDGSVIQLVPECRRARHAGVSYWRGITDVNSHSIGIEIVNPGHDYDMPAFPDVQIGAVIKLCQDILGRHSIAGPDILGHSDVAPLRKRDPGELFPWARLYREGVGLWVEPAPIGRAWDEPTDLSKMQADLRRYGYGIEVTSIADELTTAVVTAFQRHFRPARVDGRVDVSTASTLRRLLEARESPRNP